jgi:hypothetical protein
MPLPSPSSSRPFSMCRWDSLRCTKTRANIRAARPPTYPSTPRRALGKAKEGPTSYRLLVSLPLFSSTLNRFVNPLVDCTRCVEDEGIVVRMASTVVRIWSGETAAGRDMAALQRTPVEAAAGGKFQSRTRIVLTPDNRFYAGKESRRRDKASYRGKPRQQGGSWPRVSRSLQRGSVRVRPHDSAISTSHDQVCTALPAAVVRGARERPVLAGPPGSSVRAKLALIGGTALISSHPRQRGPHLDDESYPRARHKRRTAVLAAQADYFADFAFTRTRCGRAVAPDFGFRCALARCCSTSSTRSLAAQSSALARVSSIVSVG